MARWLTPPCCTDYFGRHWSGHAGGGNEQEQQNMIEKMDWSTIKKRQRTVPPPLMLLPHASCDCDPLSRLSTINVLFPPSSGLPLSPSSPPHTQQPACFAEGGCSDLTFEMAHFLGRTVQTLQFITRAGL